MRMSKKKENNYAFITANDCGDPLLNKLLDIQKRQAIQVSHPFIASLFVLKESQVVNNKHESPEKESN